MMNTEKRHLIPGTNATKRNVYQLSRRKRKTFPLLIEMSDEEPLGSDSSADDITSIDDVRFEDYAESGSQPYATEAERNFKIAAKSRSLVKYATPKLVEKVNLTTETEDDLGRSSARTSKTNVKSESLTRSTSATDITTYSNYEGLLPNMNANQDAEPEELEEILDAILPPCEYEENGKTWLLPVSATPSTRLDVVNLAELLDEKIKLYQAKPFGICPIRRDLHNQAFNEIIRQVTINCAERGLLLNRIRDEIRLTMHTYECLYESAIAFGIRKALESEQKKSDSEDRAVELTAQNKEFNEKIELLEAQLRGTKRNYELEKDSSHKVHETQVARLQRSNDQLKKQLESLILPMTSQDIAMITPDPMQRNEGIKSKTSGSVSVPSSSTSQPEGNHPNMDRLVK